jgi:hypothetical protein
MSLKPFVVQLFLYDKNRRQDQQYSDEDLLQPHSQGSVLYQQTKILCILFLKRFTIFVTNGVCLPISMIFFLEAKSLQ